MQDETAPPSHLNSSDSFNGLFELDRRDQDRYLASRNEPNAYGIIFGGQLLGQAVAAAQATVENKKLHSIHANFIRAGASEMPPPVYGVERLRDGGQIATRLVRASQGDRPLVALNASFRAEFDGFDHQRERTETRQPDQAIDLGSMADKVDPAIVALIEQLRAPCPVELRIPETKGFTRIGDEPRRNYWIRAASARSLDEEAQKPVFAYLSDLLLAGAALVPHLTPLPGPHLRSVSLDHAIWFHRPINCSEWILLETEGPNATNGINLSQGWAYDLQGRLVATIIQESLQQAV